jgi:hypothetical protein
MTEPTHAIRQWLDPQGKPYQTIELWWDDEYLSLTVGTAVLLVKELITALKQLKGQNEKV